MPVEKQWHQLSGGSWKTEDDWFLIKNWPDRGVLLYAFAEPIDQEPVGTKYWVRVFPSVEAAKAHAAGMRGA